MKTCLMIMLAMLSIAACTEDRRDRVNAPQRVEQLSFEYQVAAADTVDWQALSQRLVNGDITIDEADLGGDSWCEYTVQLQPTPAQVNPDMVPLEQTQEPYLSAFGHPRSMGFTFLITAVQARNLAPVCGSLETTLQGLDLASAEGSASGEWRPGESLVLVSRPKINEAWLGPALEFQDRAATQRLYFEHAVNSASAQGFVQGEFRFMALSSDARLVVLARNGQFAMRNREY